MFRLTRSRRRPPRRPRIHGALTCPACGSDRVCPTEWAAEDEERWRLLIRCGECETWVETTIGNAQAAALDVALDRQRAQIADALAALEAEQMAATADLIATALDQDLIDADDFAR